MKKKVAVSKRVTVKNGNALIDVPIETVKSILADIGYSGKALMEATGAVFKEAKQMAKAGVVSTTDFEKALVSGIKKTNDVLMNTSKKIVKRVLR